MSSERVLVVIGRTRHKMIAAEIQEAAKRGTNFIELRLDFLARAVDFKRFTPHKQCPWVATIRRPVDGGRYPGTEPERQTIIRQAIVSGAFEWVDLEMDIAKTIPRFGKVKRIISYHNFSETPTDLEGIYAEMLKLDADVYKIAVMGNSPEDVMRVVKLQQSAPKPTVAFSMGEIGQCSRFLALKYGAPWIYAAFNKERGVAPGLPCLDDLRTTYPIKSINEETAIFGVVGDPVGHSLSPLLHNHMYKRLGINALYLPFRVPRGMLPQALKEYGHLPVCAYSVTVPHKETAAELAENKDTTVEESNAANTLIQMDDGSFAAFNTDTAAIVESMKAHLEERAQDGPAPQLNQLSVLILGAGGAARALAFGLHAEGAQITITGRTYERAQKLAEEVKCKAVDWHARHAVPFDLLVNCTPVGMHPNVDEAPCHFSILKPGVTVFDTIYTPETTLLLREAKNRGCHVITGVDMFVRQAQRQMELFVGQTPDLELMRQIVRKALSPLTRALKADGDEEGHQPPPDEGASDPGSDPGHDDDDRPIVNSEE